MNSPITLSPTREWEDEHLLVLLKPPGLFTVQKEEDGENNSVMKWLESAANEASIFTKHDQEHGLCHRLDHQTSGLLLVAKSEDILQKMRHKFKHGEIEKRYKCLVEGEAKESFTLSHFLYGRYRGSKKVSVSEKEVKRSSHAILHGTLLRYDAEQNRSLLDIDLITGFRHQIRAQLSSIGHPLVGDSLYGSTRKLGDDSFTPFKELPREFFLHAARLSFHHPITEEQLEFHSETNA